jgi:hypothetical protein
MESVLDFYVISCKKSLRDQLFLFRLHGCLQVTMPLFQSLQEKLPISQARNAPFHLDPKHNTPAILKNTPSGGCEAG